MPRMGLLPGTVRRSRGNLPQLPLTNMYVETAITEPTQFALQSRPGLVASGTEYGAGPTRALYQADGVVSGYTVALSGSALYVNGVNTGTVNGSAAPSIAGNQMGVVVTRGTDANYYDGSTFRNIAFPDGADVAKVLEQGGRFVFIRAETHRYYWTEPLANMLDGSGDIVIDGLDYASAENEPDKLVDGLVFEDHLVLAGVSTIEFHGETGNDNAPWAPTVGRVFNKGVRATGCMALWDNAFAWVSPENIVFRYAGSTPARISDDGIEELIADSAACSVDSFFLEGHEFLRIKLDDIDLLKDAATGEWCEWDTYNQSGFIGGPALPGPVFGSTLDGKLLNLTENDEMGSTLERVFRFGNALEGGSVTMHNVVLRTNPGQVNGAVVSLRYSRDGGQTWSSWFDASMGSAGDYRTLVEWRSLGMFDLPGALFECKFTAEAQFRVSGVVYNEKMHGRSR